MNANTSNDDDVSYNNNGEVSDDYYGVSNRDDVVNDVNVNKNDAYIVNNHDIQVHNESLPENQISKLFFWFSPIFKFTCFN